jgi:hypothetical protein
VQVLRNYRLSLKLQTPDTHTHYTSHTSHTHTHTLPTPAELDSSRMGLNGMFAAQHTLRTEQSLHKAPSIFHQQPKQQQQEVCVCMCMHVYARAHASVYCIYVHTHTTLIVHVVCVCMYVCSRIRSCICMYRCVHAVCVSICVITHTLIVCMYIGATSSAPRGSDLREALTGSQIHLGAPLTCPHGTRRASGDTKTDELGRYDRGACAPTGEDGVCVCVCVCVCVI